MPRTASIGGNLFFDEDDWNDDRNHDALFDAILTAGANSNNNNDTTPCVDNGSDENETILMSPSLISLDCAAEWNRSRSSGSISAMEDTPSTASSTTLTPSSSTTSITTKLRDRLKLASSTDNMNSDSESNDVIYRESVGSKRTRDEMDGCDNGAHVNKSIATNTAPSGQPSVPVDAPRIDTPKIGRMAEIRRKRMELLERRRQKRDAMVGNLKLPIKNMNNADRANSGDRKERVNGTSAKQDVEFDNIELSIDDIGSDECSQQDGSDFCISSSGSFVYRDLRFGQDGITNIPHSMQPTLSQSSMIGSLSFSQQGHDIADENDEKRWNDELDRQGANNGNVQVSAASASRSPSREPKRRRIPLNTLSSSVANKNHELPRIYPRRSPRIRSPAKQDVRLENLIEERILGFGASSSVSLVRCKVTGNRYAKKKIPLSSNSSMPKMISTEVKTLYRCQKCPYIIGFVDAFFVDGTVHILLEYADGNSLQDVLQSARSIPEHVLSWITLQILRGLAYLHEKRIVHRDIKPANLLVLRSGEIRISDFGLTGISTLKNKKIWDQHNGSSDTSNAVPLSSFESSQSLDAYGPRNPIVFKTCQGTIAYMSPERIKEEAHSYSSDIWSLGVTLAELCTGTFPIKDTSSYFAIMDCVENIGEVVDSLESRVTPEFKQFLQQCLALDPSKRARAQTLQRHPFIVKHCGNLRDHEIRNSISEWLNMIL